MTGVERKKSPRVAIITGTNESLLYPVPPIADSAPAWNIFRLTEAIEEVDLQVISPCLRSQLPALKAFPARRTYTHVVFEDLFFHLYRRACATYFPCAWQCAGWPACPTCFPGSICAADRTG